MGIFDFFKKNRHKECRNNQHTTEVMEDEEEEADLWAQAYMAKPHCYTKEGKKPTLSFVVTEGINTILPMYPNELYRKGKNGFADIRLIFVSTSRKEEPVDLPFFHCVPALSNYALDIREPNVLIRGLNALEMGEIISGIRWRAVLKERKYSRLPVHPIQNHRDTAPPLSSPIPEGER